MAGVFTHNGNIVESLPSNANMINYNNTSSGMVATQVQAAVDELNANKQPKTDNNLTTTSKETTGAINELKSGLIDFNRTTSNISFPFTPTKNGFYTLMVEEQAVSPSGVRTAYVQEDGGRIVGFTSFTASAQYDHSDQIVIPMKAGKTYTLVTSEATMVPTTWACNYLM